MQDSSQDKDIVYGDIIQDLPVDDKTVTQPEQEVIDILFSQKSSTHKFVSELKEVVLIGTLFALISSPFADILLQRASVKSPYARIGVKTLVFVVIYWLVKNFYLAKA